MTPPEGFDPPEKFRKNLNKDTNHNHKISYKQFDFCFSLNLKGKYIKSSWSSLFIFYRVPFRPLQSWLKFYFSIIFLKNSSYQNSVFHIKYNKILQAGLENTVVHGAVCKILKHKTLEKVNGGTIQNNKQLKIYSLKFPWVLLRHVQGCRLYLWKLRPLLKILYSTFNNLFNCIALLRG